MNENTPTLTSQTIELRPLTEQDAPVLLRAAADGELWNMNMTVIPGPDTVDQYLDKAMQGLYSGTVLPFLIVRRETQEPLG
ncbi:MAG: GNAT family N-acetyltransferase, partial [Pseudomonas caspiana]